jgi:O-acetylhomoserine/O-acetylserine sulfhydrylase
VDPEMKAEWEERQKTNPMNGIMGAATGQPGGNPMQNFDMAGFLAGSSKKDKDSGSSTPVSYSDAVKSGPGGGGGGGKKGKR